MGEKELLKMKKLISICLIALIFTIIIIIILAVLFSTKNKEKSDVNIILTEEIINEDNGISENISSNNTNISQDFLEGLSKTSDDYTYLLLKQCVGNIIEDKAFCIDEIYKQAIDDKKDIYSVYYRIEDNSLAKKMNLIIKLDNKNNTFFVYSENYIKNNQLLNLKEGDSISIEGLKDDIEKSDDNIFYNFKILINDEIYMKELFERYKFDLILDLNHSYELLDEKYKKDRFNTFEEYEKYVKANKNELYIDKIIKYQLMKDNDKLQLLGVSNYDRNYIFNIQNLMEYTMILDTYSEEISLYTELYESSFPPVQAKSCIERVRKAINDKNYKFVYERLNVVQKANYYSNYNNFVKFITENFYEDNSFEFGDYIMVSDIIYQYTIYVKNNENPDDEENEFTISVTLKDNADFSISIVKNN